MSEPRQGPYVARQDGVVWHIVDAYDVEFCELYDELYDEKSIGRANAHLLASSWAMREAIIEHLDDLDNGRPINTVKLYRALASARGEGR